MPYYPSLLSTVSPNSFCLQGMSSGFHPMTPYWSTWNINFGKSPLLSSYKMLFAWLMWRPPSLIGLEAVMGSCVMASGGLEQVHTYSAEPVANER